MKVILTSDVKKVGKKGDVLEFSDGYARNCIINKKLGVEATPANLNNLKLKKANEDRIAEQNLQDAKAFAEELKEKTVTVSIKCGKDGKTFGSISTKEISDELKKQLGYDIDKKRILLDAPIKSAGAFEIPVKLHTLVTGTFHLMIKEENV